MKRFLLIALLSCVFLPSVFAQPNDLIKYDKEVVKTFLLEKIKKEKSLKIEEAQLELLGYKLDEYFTDFAKKQSFGLTQQQISDLQDSTKALASLRKDVAKMNKTLSAKQGEIDELVKEKQHLKIQQDTLRTAVKKLQGYRDAAAQMNELKNQLQASEDKYREDLKQVAEDNDKEISALKQKHDQEVAGLNEQLSEARKNLSDQEDRVKALQSDIDDLNQALRNKNNELAKWQGGVESVLVAIEGQCVSAKSTSLTKMDPLAFDSAVSSYNNMRDIVREIDPERVSSIDSQIKEVNQIMSVGKVFKEAFNYIQGRQDVEKAMALTDQLNKMRKTFGLTKDQGDEIEELITALDNQGALYSHLRTFLSQLRSKGCLPTKAKIDEQLGLIDKLKEIDGFLLMPDYHKSYMDAINKLKDNLQKAAANDRRIAPVVKDDAKFPGMIDEILNML